MLQYYEEIQNKYKETAQQPTKDEGKALKSVKCLQARLMKSRF